MGTTELLSSIAGAIGGSFMVIAVIKLIFQYQDSLSVGKNSSTSSTPVFHAPYMTEQFFNLNNSAKQHRIFYMPDRILGIVEDHEPWCLKEGFRGCTGGISEEYLSRCPNPLKIHDRDNTFYTQAYNELHNNLKFEFDNQFIQEYFECTICNPAKDGTGLCQVHGQHGSRLRNYLGNNIFTRLTPEFVTRGDYVFPERSRIGS